MVPAIDDIDQTQQQPRSVPTEQAISGILGRQRYLQGCIILAQLCPGGHERLLCVGSPFSARLEWHLNLGVLLPISSLHTSLLRQLSTFVCSR